METEIPITALRSFFEKSNTFGGFVFHGEYDMPFEHFFKILNYYIETGHNLLDAFSNIETSSWDIGDETCLLDQLEFNRLISRTSHPLMEDMFSTKKLEAVHNHALVCYSRYKDVTKPKPRIERSKACSYTSKKSVKESVFKLHGSNCLCCGTDEKIHLDHIIPVYKGGRNEVDNLQPLCMSCNSRKGIKIIDYRKTSIV